MLSSIRALLASSPAPKIGCFRKIDQAPAQFSVRQPSDSPPSATPAVVDALEMEPMLSTKAMIARGEKSNTARMQNPATAPMIASFRVRREASSIPIKIITIMPIHELREKVSHQPSKAATKTTAQASCTHFVRPVRTSVAVMPRTT